MGSFFWIFDYRGGSQPMALTTISSARIPGKPGSVEFTDAVPNFLRRLAREFGKFTVSFEDSRVLFRRCNGGLSGELLLDGNSVTFGVQLESDHPLFLLFVRVASSIFARSFVQEPA